MTTEIPKIYFNIYVAGVLRERPDYEAVNTDLLYFCLLMKANMLAKEVFTLRMNGAEKDVIKSVADLLTTTRRFMLEFFDVPEPNWKLIQNEETDDLETLRRLPDPSKAPSVQVSSNVETVPTSDKSPSEEKGYDEEKSSSDLTHQEKVALEC